MDAIELLDRQHRDVVTMFAQLIEGSPSRERKRALFRRLADALAIHATIAENHFYPSIQARSSEEKLLEALSEHVQIKQLLADLLRLSVEDEAFDAKLKALKEEVDHHVAEERRRVFPAARQQLDAHQREAIAQLMTATMADLEGKSPRLDVLGQTVSPPSVGPEAASQPLVRRVVGRLMAPVLLLARVGRDAVRGFVDGFRATRRRRHA
jgi:hypothetical protein